MGFRLKFRPLCIVVLGIFALAGCGDRDAPSGKDAVKSMFDPPASGGHKAESAKPKSGSFELNQ